MFVCTHTEAHTYASVCVPTYLHVYICMCTHVIASGSESVITGHFMWKWQEETFCDFLSQLFGKILSPFEGKEIKENAHKHFTVISGIQIAQWCSTWQYKVKLLPVNITNMSGTYAGRCKVSWTLAALQK